MELQQDGPLEGPTQPKPQRTRRRLAGALTFALLVGLTVGRVRGRGELAVGEARSRGNRRDRRRTRDALAPADAEKLDAAFAAYRECMKEHGVDMPEPVRVEAGAVDAGGVPVSGIAPATGGTLITGTGTSLTSDPMPAFDAKAFEAADKACSPILEAAGIKTFTSSSVGDAGSGPVLGSGGGIIGGAAVLGGAAAGAGDLAAMVAPIKKYAACMRKQGVDVPDPVVDEKAGTFEMKLDLDPTASDFRAADAACADGGFSFAVPARPAGE